MALQTSGRISINDIVGEFGGDAPHSLSEYYGVDSGVPNSGTIKLSDFYGKQSAPDLSFWVGCISDKYDYDGTANTTRPNAFDGNPSTWFTGLRNTSTITFTVPSSMIKGNWEVYSTSYDFMDVTWTYDGGKVYPRTLMTTASRYGVFPIENLETFTIIAYSGPGDRPVFKKFLYEGQEIIAT